MPANSGTFLPNKGPTCQTRDASLLDVERLLQHGAQGESTRPVRSISRIARRIRGSSRVSCGSALDPKGDDPFLLRMHATAAIP